MDTDVPMCHNLGKGRTQPQEGRTGRVKLGFMSEFEASRRKVGDLWPGLACEIVGC